MARLHDPYPPLQRALPRKIRLCRDETTSSYLSRLEAANALQPGHLVEMLREARHPWIDSIAAWTEHDPVLLALAMPQLAEWPASGGRTDPRLAGRPDRRRKGLACRHCALKHVDSGWIERFTTHERVVCPRHAVWIGEGVHVVNDQLPVSQCPEIITEWRHHLNLIARFGRARIRSTFETAGHISWHWYERFRHSEDFMARERSLRTNEHKPDSRRHTPVTAALYPATVRLTALLASPHWAGVARSEHPEPFLNRVSELVTGGWQPRGGQDPLRRWMTGEWQPQPMGPDTIPNPASTPATK